ncbi:MAG: ribbon-helix-helix protein, CopG family [Deltaproteobacteria bacterium]|nr:ribbon-helix-helix protein, CopG family [Deltaproteobacteria bacterium]
MQKQSKEIPSTVRLGIELDTRVDELCEEMDITKSAFIRNAVRHFVARQSHIDTLIQSARVAEADFQRTGLGVPWEEVKSWLNNWGTPGQPPLARKMQG